MDDITKVQIATAEGLALGLLAQLDKGIRLTSKGMEYADQLWASFTDLDKLLLAGFLKRATLETD